MNAPFVVFWWKRGPSGPRSSPTFGTGLEPWFGGSMIYEARSAWVIGSAFLFHGQTSGCTPKPGAAQDSPAQTGYPTRAVFARVSVGTGGCACSYSTHRTMCHIQCGNHQRTSPAPRDDSRQPSA